MLTYSRKEKSAKIVVIVLDLLYSMHLDRLGRQHQSTEPHSYKVRSPAGGEFVVGADDLRPGNILDRLVDALTAD